MLHRLRAGPALGEAELEVVRDRHKEDVVGLGGLGQDLLETRPLVRPEAAADAILKVGAAACHLEQLHLATAMIYELLRTSSH